MSTNVLKATPRQVTGKQVRALRRQGLLPGVIYGLADKSLTISLNAHEAGKILSGIGTSKILVVEVNGEPHNTLVREKQRHPVTDKLIHVDFKEVSMTEKLRTMVHLEFTGVSRAVKELSGILVSALEELEIECLPADLPEVILINLAALDEIGSVIRVADLVPPERVEFITEPDEVIAVVTAPITEAEVAAAETITAAEPEVIERVKKEEE